MPLGLLQGCNKDTNLPKKLKRLTLPSTSLNHSLSLHRLFPFSSSNCYTRESKVKANLPLPLGRIKFTPYPKRFRQHHNLLMWTKQPLETSYWRSLPESIQFPTGQSMKPTLTPPFFVAKYANLWRSCCRSRRGCLSSLFTKAGSGCHQNLIFGNIAFLKITWRQCA